MAKITNQFSWSFSRHKVFHECLRQYYYQYYGYWDGWNPDAPDRARLLYRLKNMASLPMWLGDVVHRMIERILSDLRNRELSPLESYQRQSRDILNREWVQSVEKRWQWKPKYNLNLFEHYYGIEISPQTRAAARDKVYRCIENFMESPIFRELGALRPEAWKSIEKLEQFVVGDWPVFVKLDCAVAGDGSLTIFDWKTGKESEEPIIQLGCYSLYAFHVWRVPLENQRLRLFYLDSGEIRESEVSPSDLIETREFIMKSMEEMTALLEPPASRNQVVEEKFPPLQRCSTCRRCFFREACYGTRDWE